MRFTGRGHPAVRATHGKTLELVSGPELTERGTCVVAVGAEPEPARPLAGPVRIRIAAGTERYSLDAIANPEWEPGGAVVVRRGPLRLPGTFATDADAAAADLPRELIRALQDPDILVTVDVVPIAGELVTVPVTILCTVAANSATPGAALAAELDRADRVIAEDAAARRIVGASRGEPGGRTLVVATAQLPGGSCAPWGPDVVLDTVGLPPLLAVAAASGSHAPLTIVDDANDTESLRRVPATHRLVLPLRRTDLPALLHRAATERGTSSATVMQEHGRPLRATPDDVPELPGAEQVACCLHPAPSEAAIDPPVRAAIDALVADGVATKTAAKALAALTGWERRRAYGAIVGWPVS